MIKINIFRKEQLLIKGLRYSSKVNPVSRRMCTFCVSKILQIAIKKGDNTNNNGSLAQVKTKGK